MSNNNSYACIFWLLLLYYMVQLPINTAIQCWSASCPNSFYLCSVWQRVRTLLSFSAEQCQQNMEWAFFLRPSLPKRFCDVTLWAMYELMLSFSQSTCAVCPATAVSVSPRVFEDISMRPILPSQWFPHCFLSLCECCWRSNDLLSSVWHVTSRSLSLNWLLSSHAL